MGTERRHTLLFGGVAPALGDGSAARLAMPPPAPAADDVDVDAGWDAPLTSLPPGGAVSPAPVDLSSEDLLPDDDDRPSDRVTVPNQLAPKLVELSASELADDADDAGSEEDDRSLKTTRPPPPTQRPSLEELAHATVRRTEPPPIVEPFVERRDTAPVMLSAIVSEQTTPASAPPVSLDVRAPLTSLPGDTARSVPAPRLARRGVLLIAASHLAVAASVLGFVWLTREPRPSAARAARVAITERNAVGSAAGLGAAASAAPASGCRVEDLARVIAPRAMLGPGLDASALESGFAVALASAPNEATGVRLDPSTLRTAETLRVQSMWPVGRVTVDRGSEEEDRMQVRLDASDTRTVTPSLRITAEKGGVFATEETRGTRLLWAIPGAAPKSAETVRAITRPDGATIVAVRRPGLYWVGVTGQGGLAPVVRSAKALGVPALAPAFEGGVMAWAERSAQRHPATEPFRVMVAAIMSDGGRTLVSVPEPIAEGISPALANLPSGDLLLAYSDGAAGAHRVVAQRLGPDLTTRGDLMVLSESDTNAGSPALAVDSEGRAVVAYLAFAKGQAEVRATALTCH